jgi:hypothetical protein
LVHSQDSNPTPKDEMVDIIKMLILSYDSKKTKIELHSSIQSFVNQKKPEIPLHVESR